LPWGPSTAVEQKDIKAADEQDEAEKALIASLPKSHEKRVISFGLYGNNTKYTHGAVKNSELAQVEKEVDPAPLLTLPCSRHPSGLFPWVGVPLLCHRRCPALHHRLSSREWRRDRIHSLRCRLSFSPSLSSLTRPLSGKGHAAGMFYRFLVASDTTVDRFIIRDVDSRLNSRDRLAVEDWIQSKQAIHIIRDHVNHCLPMNGITMEDSPLLVLTPPPPLSIRRSGGMWGGVNGALPMIKEQVEDWSDR
jgi:hypothetical protein